MWREYFQQSMKSFRYPAYYSLKETFTKDMTLFKYHPAYAAATSSGLMKFFERATQTQRVGILHMLQLNTIVEERDEYIVITCRSSREFSPGALPELILPDVPDPEAGVVIRKTGKHWLDSHLVVEYSKVASWVAIQLASDSAVIVHTVVPDKYPLGKIFKY